MSTKLISHKLCKLLTLKWILEVLNVNFSAEHLQAFSGFGSHDIQQDNNKFLLPISEFDMLKNIDRFQITCLMQIFPNGNIN